MRPSAAAIQTTALLSFAISIALHLMTTTCYSAEPARKIIVAADGSGDFADIAGALASIKDATQAAPVDIMIKPGTYKETIRTRNWINLIGEDRDKCIVTYDCGTNNIVYSHTIAATSNTKIKNLTLIGQTVKYVIHSDGGRDYILTIENCALRREYPTPHARSYAAAFGIGLRAGQHIVMQDCALDADLPIYMHNWNDQKSSCSMTLEKCSLKGQDYALGIYLLGSKQRDFFVIHDSTLNAAKGSINYVNMREIKGKTWRGENEMVLLGSGNTLAGITGTEMKDDANNRLSGVQLSQQAVPCALVPTNAAAQTTSAGLPAGGVFRFGKHEGNLIMPPDYRADRKYPLIIHFYGRGGNHIESNLMSESFAPFRQKALARGYIMVTPNCGSASWMNAAAEEVALQCVEYVKAQSSIDDNRIYILGCSMGGGAALTFAGRHPDKVSAVCDIFGVTDFERFYREGFFCQSLSAAFGGTPDEKPEVYRARSGISYIEQLKTVPLLVIHGDKDGSVPLWNSQGLVEKLRGAGANPKFIIVPGKGHDNSIISGLEDTVLDHFDATVKNKRATQGPREEKAK